MDLVNDALRSRKRFKAAGRGQFCSALRAAGLPENFVGNREFWRDGVMVVPHSSASLTSSHSILESFSQPSVSTPLRSSNNNNNRRRIYNNKSRGEINDSSFQDALDAEVGGGEEEETNRTGNETLSKKKK